MKRITFSWNYLKKCNCQYWVINTFSLKSCRNEKRKWIMLFSSVRPLQKKKIYIKFKLHISTRTAISRLKESQRTLYREKMIRLIDIQIIRHSILIWSCSRSKSVVLPAITERDLTSHYQHVFALILCKPEWKGGRYRANVSSWFQQELMVVNCLLLVDQIVFQILVLRSWDAVQNIKKTMWWLRLVFAAQVYS